MNKFTRYIVLLLSTTLVLPVLAEDKLSGEEIINQCYYKYPGDDQRSNMTITLQAGSAKPQTTEYLRLWKNYKGENGIVDKVILFTESPAHKKGLAFMRWGYSYASQKKPDQWIYLPDLRKVRRISPRDPETKEWVIKDEDLRIREAAEDTHNYTGINTLDGESYYVVEFIPKGEDIYSKRVTYFKKTKDWGDCIEQRTDFFDKSDKLVKQKFVDWNKIGNAWAWNSVNIKSTTGNDTIRYTLSNVEVNVGLKDSDFDKSVMAKGIRK